MVQPIDYSLNVKTPFEAAVEGYKVGLAGQEAAAQRQLLEAQRAKALADADKLRAEQKRAADARIAVDGLLNNPNAGPEDFRKVAAALSKEERDFLMKVSEDRSIEQKRADALFNAEVMSAIVAGQPEKAFNRMTEQVAALTNSGRKNDARVVQSMIDLARITPKKLQDILGVYMAVDEESNRLLDRAATATKPEDKTTLQREYDFIKQTLGPKAAADLLMNKADPLVYITLDNGEQYVGSRSYFEQKFGIQKPSAPGQAAPAGQGPKIVTQQGIDFILNNAMKKRRMDKATLDTLNQAFGSEGQTQMNKWLLDNNVRVVTRRGYDKATGKSVVEFSDGKVEYGTD
jgi:hypothetical protein